MVQTCLWPLYLLYMYVCLLLPWSVIWRTLAQPSFWGSLSDTNLFVMHLPHTSCHLAQGMCGLLWGGQEATIDNWTNRSWHQPAEHLKASYANSCTLCWGGREKFLCSSDMQPPLRQLLSRWEHLQYFLLLSVSGLRQETGQLRCYLWEVVHCVTKPPVWQEQAFLRRRTSNLFIFLSQALELITAQSWSIHKTLHVMQQTSSGLTGRGGCIFVCWIILVEIWDILVEDSSDVSLRHGGLLGTTAK